MRRSCVGCLLLLLLMAGCTRSPLRGGTRIADDVFWRLNMLGDGERTPTDSDSVFVRVRMARPGAEPGSMYSTERWYAMGEGKRTSLFFGRMRQGDSATVLLRSAYAPWTELGATAPPLVKDTGWVQMELSLREVRSREESRALARAILMARNQGDEDRILTDFLSSSKLPWMKSMGVWYTLDTTAGTGPNIQSGQLVTLTYTATFLDNGAVFDEQTAKDGGLTFRLGDPGQVIKGLEIAAHLLPERGGAGRFIIPSELAFGPSGSSSGIVPPWTPVLYEIRVQPSMPDEGQAAR
ncbi:MAG: FKBP-type peptidyl-prolyl cis-trans isomerase [Flavobacteriales bacterium]|nr:FKBP-type peptidyl-prolyl cis-trans isomerase [Flavobacteriales bacterium]